MDGLSVTAINWLEFHSWLNKGARADYTNRYNFHTGPVLQIKREKGTPGSACDRRAHWG